MGKQRKRLLCAILCLVVALSCMPVNEVKAATSVKLSATVVNLTQAQKIAITVLNATGDVTWTSDNKKIAAVNKGGTITAGDVGSTYVRAKVGNKSLKCKVNVYRGCIKDSSFDNYLDYVLLTEGQTVKKQLDGATPVSFTSENKKIATVSKKGVITAKKSGITNVIIKDKNGVSYKVVVTVQKKGTSLIKPTAIQKNRIKSSKYVSYKKLMKNNHYDTTIITDKIVKNTTLTNIDKRNLPYMNGIILENKGWVKDHRNNDMSGVYTKSLKADAVTEAEIEFQAKNGFNCIRMMYSLAYLSKGSDTSKVNESELLLLDEIVSWCLKNNMTLMLSFSEAPGNPEKEEINVLTSDEWLKNEKMRQAMENYIALLAQ